MRNVYQTWIFIVIYNNDDISAKKFFKEHTEPWFDLMHGLHNNIVPLCTGYPIMYNEISIVKDIYWLAMENDALVYDKDNEWLTSAVVMLIE